MNATMVTLVDGQVVTTDAEAWRHETLARHVLNIPGLDARRAWLADFEKKHGVDDAVRLMETIQQLHDKARAA